MTEYDGDPGETCARCGASATVAISRLDGRVPVTHLYCEPCWRTARYEAAPIMLEGPIHWGQDWAELEAWLDRNLRDVHDDRHKRKDAELWRRLLAHDLQRQRRHLSSNVPPSVAAFLEQYGDGAA